MQANSATGKNLTSTNPCPSASPAPRRRLARLRRSAWLSPIETLETRRLLSVTVTNGLPDTDALYYSVNVEAGGTVYDARYAGNDTVYGYRGYFVINSTAYDLGSYASGSVTLDGDTAVSKSIITLASGKKVTVDLESRVPPSTQTLVTRYAFTADSGVDLRTAKFFQYLDADILSPGDDVLRVSGTVLASSLRVVTVDPATLIQQSQSLGLSLISAQCTGFAAARYSTLRDRITSGTFDATTDGTSIDTAELPAGNFPGIGAGYGPADNATALEYSFTNASTAVVRTALGASDIAINVPDLAVTSVTAPPAVGPGANLHVSWIVRNQSDTAAAGSWTDRAYLSADATWSADDTAIGSVVHNSGLGAYATYPASLDVPAASRPTGVFYVVVRTDDAGVVSEGRLESNNARAATAVTDLSVAAIALGQSASGTVGTVGRYFAVTVPAGTRHLVLSLDDADNAGRTELYVSNAAPPTRTQYAYRSAGASDTAADRELVITSPSAGTWYILVTSPDAAGSGAFTLAATSPALDVTTVTPAESGNTGPVVVRIIGAGFDDAAGVALVGATSNVYLPTSIDRVSLTELYAVFDGATLPPGSYSLRVSEPGETDVLRANALHIVSGGNPNFELNLVTPQRMGYHQLATLWVEYANTGQVAMPAPLVFVGAVQNNREGALMTLDASIVRDGFWTSAVPEGFTHTVQFLASGQTTGWLMPGESARVPVYYAGWQQPWDLSYPAFSFKCSAINADATALIDWPSMRDSMKPAGLSEEAWRPLFSNIQAQVGNTWGGYVSMLDNNAAYLASIGQRQLDAKKLLALEAFEADGLAAGTFLSTSIDASIQATGLSLSVARAYPQRMTARFHDGPYGRGWVTSWETRLVKRDDGTVEMAAPDLASRVFQPDRRGGYLSGAGERATLTALPAGAFSLREPGGTTFTFDADGLPKTIEDRNANRITATFTAGQLTRLQHTSGAFINLAYDAFSHISTLTDSFGRVTTLTYDFAHEHLIAAAYPDGRSVAYTYDSSGILQRRHALISATYAGAISEAFTYDSRGRLTGISGGAGGSINLSYSDDGTRTMSDSLGRSSRTLYDYRGLTVRTIDAAGRGVDYAFDAEMALTTITDPLGASSSLAYDAAGNLTSITDPLGNKDSYAYAAGSRRPASFTNARGAQIDFGYDTAGNLTFIEDAADHRESYTYDAAGRLISSTNRRGQTITYAYDAQGHLTSKSVPAGAGSAATFTYNAQGLPTSMTDVTGTTTFTYTAAGFIDRVTYPAGLYLDFDYDAAGRRTRMTDQANRQVNYAYDVYGRLQRLSTESNATIATYTYDPAGRLSRKDLGTSGAYTLYGYNNADDLTLVENHGAAGAVVSRFAYVYSASGDLTSLTTLDGVWTYTYDATGRLTHAVFASSNTAVVPNQNIAFEYDAAGNRTKATLNGTDSAYTSNNLDQYTQAGSAVFTYDLDGNVITRTDATGLWTFTYDAESRLTGVVHGASTWSYVYNAVGQRVRSTLNGVSTTYVIDPASLGSVAGEYNTAGNQLVAQYIGAGGLVARRASDNSLSFYAFDAQGSTSEVLSAAGSVADRYRYDPFGNVLTRTESIANDFEFVGELGVMADATGLSFMRARHYDPTRGRFIQQDPSGLAGGSNPYTYVENAPTMAVDPSGLQSVYHKMLMQELFKIYAHNKDAIRAIAKIVNTGALEGLAAELGANVSALRLCYQLRYVQGLNVTLAEAAAILEGGATATAVTGTAAGTAGATGTAVATGGGITAMGAAAAASLGILIWGAGTWATGAIGSATGSDWLTDVSSAMDSVWTAEGWATARDYYFGSSNPVGSQDPNQKLGPAGVGAANFVDPSGAFPYHIDFENDATATAPAQFVKVTDTLDAKLDPATFEITDVGFGDMVFAVPAHTQQFATSTTMTYAGITFRVDITIALAGNVITAMFSAIDPATELPPDVTAGFLPPEDGTGRGMGYFAYVINPVASLVTGDKIRNIASIQFDLNDPIATNQIDPHDASKGTDPAKEALVTIDVGAPSSAITALAAKTPRAAIPVAWTGRDDTRGSGVASYDIYAAEGPTGPFTLWLDHTTATTAVYPGKLGKTYRFYSVARDRLGHLEAAPSTADTSTTVSAATTVKVGPGQSKALSYTDADGTKVTLTLNTGLATVSLGGTGVRVTRTAAGATVTGTDVQILAVALSATTATSTLTITAKGGTDAVATVGKITTAKPLATISAGAVDLVGEGITATGTASIKKIVVRDLLNGADITVPAGALTLTAGAIGAGSRITAGTSIAALAANQLAAGAEVATPLLTKLTTKALARRSLAGDCRATLTLGTASASAAGLTVLGSAAIAGAAGGLWTVRGSAGTLAAATTRTDWSLVASGAVTSLHTTGDLAGTVSAKSLGSIDAGANLTDLAVSTSLAPGDQAALSIGSIHAAGWIQRATFRAAGNIGPVTAAAMRDALVFAGLATDRTTLPDTATDLVSQASIASVSILGIASQPSIFSNTRIAAATLGNVSVTGPADPDNFGSPFGLAAETLGVITGLTPSADLVIRQL